MQKRVAKGPGRRHMVFEASFTVASVLVFTPLGTGMLLHELLGTVIAFAIVVHMLLHWRWLVATTRAFTRSMSAVVRFNYLVNACLFIAMIVAIVSGLFISEAVVPMLGLPTLPTSYWLQVHIYSADVALATVGLHLAANYRFVARVLSRMRPRWPALRTQPARPEKTVRAS